MARKRIAPKKRRIRVPVDVHAPDSGKPTEPATKTAEQREALAGALAAFIPGKHGTEQPVWLRSYLRSLESNGYIRYDSEGWHLTDKGREALKW